ncbi:Uncharacterized conserved protein [Luteibacter sp. UNCMF331Sha3.1]|uniref:ATP-dependent zinc protease family protein n=1 Tax=Luteibacter sp. UNCMF331Sha3.1 TaxID=1502760 RepID=UPI0008CDAE12|nr:RimK/LysX family protein [Luteibacter sp. UNCMF331Sha3.1]SEM39656.1 Uncharacterized conserved protein [Luteibacter sp. UNCMF331Sha3.1]
MTDVVTLGWRERLALPSLGVPVLKAKLDTGARSSALHVEWLEVDERPDGTWLRFQVRTTRKGGLAAPCEARATGRRSVTDSGGHSTVRWFIETEVELAGRRFVAEVNLTDRRHMLFPLLLGRTALDGRFLVDPSLSYSQTPRRVVRDPS